MENGAFEGLAGFGKPLPKDDAAYVPEELRMGYRIMKNAGFANDYGFRGKRKTLSRL